MTYAFILKFLICCHTAHLDFSVGGSYKSYFRMYSFYKCMKKQRLCWQFHQFSL
ncbi:mCG141111 [Mus musculus]|nr:mCG141111 [Mus musculus]